MFRKALKTLQTLSASDIDLESSHQKRKRPGTILTIGSVKVNIKEKKTA